MVNYQNPATIAAEFAALVKLWHVVHGIFIWEFFTTLDYEWDVIRGIRPYRWTIWIYSSARVFTLLSGIVNMIGIDTTTPINCQLYATFAVAFAYSGFAASSLLIVLRIIAIWNKNKIVSAISVAIWIADIGMIVNGTVGFRSWWSHESNSCPVAFNAGTHTLSAIAILFTDVVLLLIMLIGLLRMRLESSGALRFGLGRILWNQGLIWLFIATVAEVFLVVFMALNLNGSFLFLLINRKRVLIKHYSNKLPEPLDFLFQTPALVAVSIAATNMYRSLANVRSPDLSHDTPLGGVRAVSDLRHRSGPIPLNRIEVAVRTEHDKFPISYVNTDQGCYKSQEVSLSGDAESGPEK